MRPYYADSMVTLYHGDCREVLPSIDVSGVSCVIADPPYGETTLEKNASCEWCDRGPTEAHHYLGYERQYWLTVRWLCRSCHLTTHKRGWAAAAAATALPSALPCRAPRRQGGENR